jgi:hypothetical protein
VLKDMTTIDSDLIEQLRQHAKIHELDRIAKEAITGWIDSERNEFPSDFDLEQFQAVFASRWLCFEPEIVSYPYIDTRFNLLYRDVPIGYYRLITMLDGRVEDDYFVIENFPTTDL